MQKEELLSALTTLFRDVLENDAIVLTDETTANDIEEWDSLNHIQLVVAVEKHFNIRFTAKEIQSWKNIGSLILDIQKKQTN